MFLTPIPPNLPCRQVTIRPYFGYASLWGPNYDSNGNETVESLRRRDFEDAFFLSRIFGTIIHEYDTCGCILTPPPPDSFCNFEFILILANGMLRYIEENTRLPLPEKIAISKIVFREKADGSYYADTNALHVATFTCQNITDIRISQPIFEKNKHEFINYNKADNLIIVGYTVVATLPKPEIFKEAPTTAIQYVDISDSSDSGRGDDENEEGLPPPSKKFKQ